MLRWHWKVENEASTACSASGDYEGMVLPKCLRYYWVHYIFCQVIQENSLLCEHSDGANSAWSTLKLLYMSETYGPWWMWCHQALSLSSTFKSICWESLRASCKWSWCLSCRWFVNVCMGHTSFNYWWWCVMPTSRMLYFKTIKKLCRYSCSTITTEQCLTSSIFQSKAILYSSSKDFCFSGSFYGAGR